MGKNIDSDVLLEIVNSSADPQNKLWKIEMLCTASAPPPAPPPAPEPEEEELET